MLAFSLCSQALELKKKNISKEFPELKQVLVWF